MKLICALLFLVGCAHQASPRPTAVEGAPDAGVYAALIASLPMRRVPDTLLLVDSTLQFRAPGGGVPQWRTQFDSIPPELSHGLDALSRSKRASEQLPLPRPVRIVSAAALREIFSLGVRGGWEELHRRYPNQRGYLRFSPVAFSADTLDALVYYESHCGGLCGRGAAVWLTRRASAHWRVRKVVQFWVS
jgi:hypothetical protein